MRFKDVFSIIGPAMIGPSSSHTAGAVRLGRVARHILAEVPQKAEITFYGSFAETYQGHGTDYAIIGGLLDYETFDQRIATSLATAEQMGIEISFKRGKALVAHPNTVLMHLTSKTHEVKVVGSSIGGGTIEINHINNFDVNFSGSYPTLLIFHLDRPGMVAELAQILLKKNINIAYMDIDRKGRSSEALTALELDSSISTELIDEISRIPSVTNVSKVDITGGVSQ
ncbi:L-serine ammonia-lyase, iron-sulfur-dependent, subunit beta [Paenibacillus psychroresistens]|uniref:L-serine deaminase n=1 Tax=Paenibacillus psychroresistens TaxID=1778678 RepID=A0A6B8RLN0_9BACL|nr:L-serine ammonia-lyase, iron-sulfur-dependent subunit beta [Paenibacillus psychroresistens]QGQ96443.1 L-serine ammonia-lyase, iron-sulfur-dependent, subunit beta [Paenibacillus psychroresistens]